MENILGCGDIIGVIVKNLSDCDIIHFLQINKNFYEFFKAEKFWLQRFVDIYGKELVDQKPYEISWKIYYISISKCICGENVDNYLVNAIHKEYDYTIPFFVSLGANNWERGLYHSALRGSLKLVRYFMSEHKNVAWGLFAAARNHHMHLIEYFEESKLYLDYVFGLCGAAEGGHQDLIDYFGDKGGGNYGGWDWALQKASKFGDLEIVMYLIKKGAKNLEGGMIWASIGGHLNLVQFYKESGIKDFDYPLFNAALHNHEDLCKYLAEIGGSLKLGLAGAAGGGHLNLVKYFIEEKHASGLSNALFQAAEYGSHEIVDYLVEKGVTNWSIGLRGAIYGQHDSLITFFLEKLNEEN